MSDFQTLFQNDLVIESIYMLSSVFFILSLGGLSNPESSKKGNLFGMYGMFLAVVATLFTDAIDPSALIKFGLSLLAGGIIGIRLALSVEMIAMPQLVAELHSFVGLAATIVGYGSYYKYETCYDTAHEVEMYIGIFIGVITFVGSIVAWGKLDGKIGSEPLIIGGSLRHFINLIIVIATLLLGYLFVESHSLVYVLIMTALAAFLGWHLIMAIGGADMPVVVSMLNSYSGWATAASGFMLESNLLILSGALVGSSGAILSYIMCKAMNRSFWSVLMGGFGMESSSSNVKIEAGAEIKEATLQDVVGEIKAAKSIIFVPGYGMAVSRCQDVVGQLCKELKTLGKTARFCIHPVAGRLPGHMNVLLAEANVPYNYVCEMEEINKDFASTDVVLVVGANDIVNPDAIENPESVIAGMPVCEVWKSKTVFVIKRSIAKGYAAIENPLFYKKNTRMFFGDAKKQISAILDEIAKGSMGASTQKKQQEEKIEIVVEKDEDMSPYLSKCVREIGVPREVHPGERRVALTPTVVKKLIKIGFKVKIEQGAGDGAGFSDDSYRKVGARITNTRDIWENSEIIVKVRAPEFNNNIGDHEANALSNTILMISYVYPGQNPDLVTKLVAKKPNLTVFALDCTPRITRAQKLDTLSSTANLAGYRAVIEAFTEFPRFSKGVSSAAGKVEPAKVLIMGAGVAGLAAIGIAKGLGSIVRAFDARAVVKEQVESLGAEFLEVDYKEDGEGSGGYAKEMSEGYKQAQRKMIKAQAQECDIVITTALIPGKRAPILIDTETARIMKPNSVIVDLAAEMGGNCELTKPGEKFVDPISRVIILGYVDLPSRMAQQSSELFAANMYHLFEELVSLPKNPKNSAKDFRIDYDDEIQKGLSIIAKGQVLWKPPSSAPPQANTNEQKPPEKSSQNTTSQKKVQVFDIESNKQDEKVPLLHSSHDSIEESSTFSQSLGQTLALIAFFVLIGIMATGEPVLLNRIFIFVLAIFIGYMVIWNVSAALHTPLMSVTNAISGIIIVGCMLELKSSSFLDLMSLCGIVGVFFASINIFGGFIVTQKMLNMFKMR